MRCVSVLIVVSLALSSAVQAQEAGVVDSIIIKQIDNDRVMADIASAKDSGFQESIELPGAVRFGNFSPVVATLIPMKIFQDLRTGIAPDNADEMELVSANGESSIEFEKNGYTATSRYPDRGFNLIIEGSDLAYTGSNDDEPGFVGIQPDYKNVFEESASFGYAGADYVLLIECAVGDADCSSKAEMQLLLKDFVLCSAEYECVNAFPIDAEEQP